MTKNEKYILIKNILTDKHRKSFFLISKDLLELKNKNSLKDLKYYFRSLMYKKDAGDLSRYVDDKAISRIQDYHLKEGKHYYLDHKIRFSELMTESDIIVPLYLGKIEKGSFYDNKGNCIALKDKIDLLPIFDQLTQKQNVIFVKSADSSGGKGVFRFKPGSSFDLSEFNLQDDYLIEKGLTQHKALNDINPDCINSLRIITLNKNGKIEIPSSFLRLGVNQSHVDNASSGGIFINYDLEKNQLDKIAKKLTVMGGESYYSHPHTNYVFKDQPLPYLEKVIALVIKAAKVIPDKVIIGWDIAYTPEGPVILEGNKNPCASTTQISLRGLRNNKIYEEIYQQYYLQNS